MAVHLSIGRIPSIFLLALLALPIAAGTAHVLSRSGPEAETASATQITAAVQGPAEPRLAVSSPSALEPRTAGSLPGSPAKTATRHDREPTMPAERTPEVAAGVEVEAAPAPAAALAVPSAAAPAADAVQTASAPAATPTVAPPVAPFVATEPAAPRRRVTIARLVTEPQHPPVIRDLVRSTSRPKNMAPIPTRAPRADKAEPIVASSAAALFKKGAEIKVKKDASVYITSRNIPENDRLLEAYSTDQPNGDRVRTTVGEAAAVPGLLGIAAQAQRARGGGQANPAYSLADAMRDAIWRKTTAARLKSLTTAQNVCAEGTDDTAKAAPSIGLIASC
jgi:hypothetical protein